MALLVAAACLAGAVAPTAAAKNLALLVAVTQYDEKTIRQLEGPSNDVVLMWRELRRRGFQAAAMTVLADNLPLRDDIPRAAGAPTRAAILGGLQALAAKAQAGDFVVFQFSGHGTTQPVTDPAAQIEPEPDGRDQVLLPRDAGFYDDTQGSIRNGIIDDELARVLDAIRLKGATVWVVVDACHSGTVTRSGGDSVARTVRPSTLGVPAGPGPTGAAPVAARRVGTFVARASADKAPLIGFYAVDSRSEAIERTFPGFAPGLVGLPKRERIGVFTAHLTRALAAGKATTFRDLARLVSRDMAKLRESIGAPLPVFDGDLDRPIGGGEIVPAVRHDGHVDEKGVAVAAGTLHGFEVGAVLALHDGPLLHAKRLGRARVVESTAATSLAVVEPGGPPVIFGTDVLVEVEEPAVSFAYRVARPENFEGVDRARIDQLIDKAKQGSTGRRTLALELVAASEAADLRLMIAQGRLWAVPEGQPLVTDAKRPGTSISVDLALADAAFAGALRRILWSMARATNLVRMASASPDASEVESPVTVDVEISRESDSSRMAEPRRACDALAKPQAPVRLTPAVPVAAGHCDMFSVILKNNGDRDIDVAVIYLELARRDRSGGRAHGEQRLHRHAAVQNGRADAPAVPAARDLGRRQAAGARAAAAPGIRDAAQRHQPAFALPSAGALGRGRSFPQRRRAGPCRNARPSRARRRLDAHRCAELRRRGNRTGRPGAAVRLRPARAGAAMRKVLHRRFAVAILAVASSCGPGLRRRRPRSASRW